MVGRGVYAMAGAPTTWHQLAMAACLAGPPGTVASHLTAAALHGLARPPRRPHVTVPRSTSGRVCIAVVHHAAANLRRERAFVGGIQCTDVTRTLIDCAGVLGYEPLCDVIDEAFCGGLSHPTALQARLAATAPGRGVSGVGALRAALDAWAPGIEPGSVAEMRLLRQLSEWRFDPPEAQVDVVGPDGLFVGRLDVAWPDARVGLEYDGDRWHNPRNWTPDEQRLTRFEALGWRVRRVDKYDLRAGDDPLRTSIGDLTTDPDEAAALRRDEHEAHQAALTGLRRRHGEIIAALGEVGGPRVG